MTKYVVQYRVRANRGQRNEGMTWKDAEEFDTVERAIEVQKRAIADEAKGTKDWRVRVVAT